jgi:hypothetical protein
VVVKRWHLVELEDLSWVPAPVKDGARDVLDWMFAKLGMYRPVVSRLRAMLDATGERSLVDLCAGGGGGSLATLDELRRAGDADTRLVLTDRFPSASAAQRIAARGDPNLRYHAAPVDAFAVPPDLRGVRTMYSALHHFRPGGVRRLVASAVADRAPLAFFDVAASPTLRKLPGFLVPLAMIPNLLVLLVLTPLLVPWVRPVRASRLFFTYLLPLIPIVYAWDGAVSALRAYRPEELAALAREVPGADGYLWESGRIGDGPRAVVWLTGRPA